ncbi:MAG TPA: hypothetical protein VLX91_01555 [Candidatus Acidoferrales bacterium]|nr:hypothetical protein [Candidatus Acidoferrales bacterium]
MSGTTSQGLAQEQGALSVLATSNLQSLEKRGVTSDFLAKYKTLAGSMETTVAASGGKRSEKMQLSASELNAKDQLLADIRRIQGGAKRVFEQGKPQLKEFFVGEYFNHSTGLLLKWSSGIEKAWDKYKNSLLSQGNLVQDDLDSMVANAAALQSVDSTQENAKHVDAPEATAAALKAMADVEAAANFIYGAAEAEFAKNPKVLGEFERLKPLRYAVQRNPKSQPTPPPVNPPTQKN